MAEVVELLLRNQINKLIIMKYWPVPDSYTKNIPADGSSGSFWEDRGDRFHCGIDIYAPEGSKVLSIDNGKVIKTGIFTSPKQIPYWNQTKFIIIKTQKNIFFKYAELKDIAVKEKEIVKIGQIIGHVGTVLNLDKINDRSPKYIQDIKNSRKSAMLHLEVYTSKPENSKKYLGGNWFEKNKPKNLINPKIFIRDYK